MISSQENNTYDYLCSTPSFESGFSRFPDGSKFKYNCDGEICLAIEGSTWAKRLLKNMPLYKYLESEWVVPQSDFLTFPEFGTLERKKQWKKESVGNYIEDCELCGEYMEKTFNFHEKLVCNNCNESLKKQKCTLCKGFNSFVINFINDYEKTDIPFEIRLIKRVNTTISTDFYLYCKTCEENLSHLNRAYMSGRDYYLSEPYLEPLDYEDPDVCSFCEGGTSSLVCRDCMWILNNDD